MIAASADMRPGTAADTSVWEDYRDSWVRSLRARNLAPRTITSYAGCVYNIARWALTQTPPIVDPTMMSKAQVVDYLAWQNERPTYRGKPHSAGSVAKEHRSIRVFFTWLAAEEDVANPMTGVAVPLTPEQPVDPFSDDELSALLGACKGSTFVQRRDTALIRLLLDTGVRLAEAAMLRLDEVSMRDGVVQVMGKGRRRRAVPVSAKTVEALDRYLRARRRHKDASSDWFWLAEHPHRGKMGTSGVQQMLARRAREAGIEGRANPHRFRHTAASAFLAAGGLEGDAMHLFGWKSQQMLHRYTAKQAHDRAIAAARRFALGDRV